MFAYAAASEGELSLSEGEIITVTSRELGTAHAGWWQGLATGGREGLFPSNYVEELGRKFSQEL